MHAKAYYPSKTMLASTVALLKVIRKSAMLMRRETAKRNCEGRKGRHRSGSEVLVTV